MEPMLNSGWVNSGGAVNHVMSHIVRHAIDMGLQYSFIDQLCNSYRDRVSVMDDSLTQHLSKFARWSRPKGGYFFWLELNNSIDATALQKRAFEYGVGFQPGEVFSSSGEYKNFIRLSFAHYSVSEIREGIERLSTLMRLNSSPLIIKS
jgi:2-aminoadipate transaminase